MWYSKEWGMKKLRFSLLSVQGLLLVSSVAQSCLTLCDPMDCNTLGFSVSLSPTPAACSNSCPSSWWCHPTISSSVVPFSSCLQFSPASGSFPMSQLFTSGGQSFASVLPINIQGRFLLGLAGLISLQSKGFLRDFSNTTVQKHQFLGAQPSLWTNYHIHTWLLEKQELWLCGPLSEKWCFSFFIHCLHLS